MKDASRMPRTLLRLEGASVLAVSLILYFSQGWSLLLFIVLFFVPDLSMIGYLKDKRIGSYLYNLGHTYTFPAALAMTSVLYGSFLGLQVSVIWFGHIGLDRMIGYGLKYKTNFKHTHLQRV